MRSISAVPAALFAFVLPLVLVAPAAAGGVQTNHDAAADFKSYKTYQWQTPKGPGGDSVDGPVRAAAEEALATKGLRRAKAGESADLELRYNAGAVSALTAGVGVAPGWWGGLVLIPAGEWYTTAGIAVILTDLATGKVVWTGWKVVKGTNPDAPMVMAKRAPKYTSQILAKYPPS